MGTLEGFASLLPRRSRDLLYRCCKRYVDHYEGTNNPDIATNGELRLLRSVIPSSEIVFDVGANVGEWAALVLGVNPALRLHCFEPSQEAFRRLVSRGLPTTVVSNNFGLSSKRRRAALFLFGAANPLNSLYRREGLAHLGLSAPCGEEQVEVRTLDDYCRDGGVDRIDYLKVDVEGHELDVLQGAEGMLAHGRVRMVQFE